MNWPTTSLGDLQMKICVKPHNISVPAFENGYIQASLMDFHNDNKVANFEADEIVLYHSLAEVSLDQLVILLPKIFNKLKNNGILNIFMLDSNIISLSYTNNLLNIQDYNKKMFNNGQNKSALDYDTLLAILKTFKPMSILTKTLSGDNLYVQVQKC
jgi:hypothetical protein